MTRFQNNQVNQRNTKETTMNKFILALAAVAALSVPALASQRNSELPELQSRGDIMQPGSSGEALFVVKGSGHKMTNFEALTAWSQLRSETNQH
jgi:photosystem II stability/assembly factor-like uncharacterized protein